MSINSIGSNIPIEVSKGGTAVASVGAYTVVCAGTTGTNPLQNAASVGVAGQILTSNGAGALPSFQDPINPIYTGPIAFTPIVSFGGNSVGITYTTQTAYYVRIGTFYYMTINIVLSSKGSSTGTLQIRNIPTISVAAMSRRQELMGALYDLSLVANAVITPFIVQDISNPALSAISFAYPGYTTLANPTNLTDTFIGNATQITISGNFITI